MPERRGFFFPRPLGGLRLGCASLGVISIFSRSSVPEVSSGISGVILLLRVCGSEVGGADALVATCGF